jgi:hypothetical protein
MELESLEGKFFFFKQNIEPSSSSAVAATGYKIAYLRTMIMP